MNSKQQFILISGSVLILIFCFVGCHDINMTWTDREITLFHAIRAFMAASLQIGTITIVMKSLYKALGDVPEKI